MVAKMEQDTAWNSEQLARSEWFASLNAEARHVLGQRMRRRRYKAGTVLFNKGDMGITLYLIIKGQVRLLDPVESGEELIIGMSGEGESIGELSLFDGQPRSATAIALNDVEVLALAREDFIAVIRAQPDLALVLMANMARTIRRMNEEVEGATLLDLPGKVAKKLLEMSASLRRPAEAEVVLKITQEELAGTVGASRVSVNKILGDFADAGAVLVAKGRVTILKPELLRRRIVY